MCLPETIDDQRKLCHRCYGGHEVAAVGVASLRRWEPVRKIYY